MKFEPGLSTDEKVLIVVIISLLAIALLFGFLAFIKTVAMPGNMVSELRREIMENNLSYLEKYK